MTYFRKTVVTNNFDSVSGEQSYKQNLSGKQWRITGHLNEIWDVFESISIQILSKFLDFSVFPFFPFFLFFCYFFFVSNLRWIRFQILESVQLNDKIEVFHKWIYRSDWVLLINFITKLVSEYELHLIIVLQEIGICVTI